MLQITQSMLLKLLLASKRKQTTRQESANLDSNASVSLTGSEVLGKALNQVVREICLQDLWPHGSSRNVWPTELVQQVPPSPTCCTGISSKLSPLWNSKYADQLFSKIKDPWTTFALTLGYKTSTQLQNTSVWGQTTISLKTWIISVSEQEKQRDTVTLDRLWPNWEG